MDNRNEKLTHNLIYNSISLNENENILVEVIGEDGLELANEIIKQAKIINAKPHLNIINYEDLRNFLINATKEDIIEYGKKDYEIMKKMQAYIGISAPTSDKSLNGVSQEKLELYNKYYTALVHLEQRVKHTKWCILRYPNEYFAKKSNMTLNEFKDFYYNVCNVDYNKMKIAMEPLKELMNKTDKVHIVAPGTDLTFSINGKIVKATAKENSKELNEILDTDGGARYIGEFAFGLNPYVNNTMCDTLFDEKINGSFHLTPGMALEESDNGNRSAIHWDIVKILRKEFGGGEIYFDDILIMKDGKFILEDLKELNAENLK